VLFLLTLTGLLLAVPSPDDLEIGSPEVASTKNDLTAPAWSVHGQLTYQLQGHGGFHAPYAGRDSFLDRKEERGPVTVFGCRLHLQF